MFVYELSGSGFESICSHSSGSGDTWFVTIDCSYTYLAIYDDQRTCLNKVVLVGVMLLIVLPLQNKSFLNSFAVRQFDVRFYKNTVNL